MPNMPIPRTSTVINQKLIQDRLQGMTLRELEAKYHIDKSNIHKRLCKAEVSEEIQAGLEQQIRLIPKANDVLKETLENNDRPELKLKAASIVFDNTGISGTRTPSPILIQLTQVNNTITLSPTMTTMLKAIDNSLTLPDEAKQILDDVIDTD